MANLTFADTHNMVTYLSKSDASIGFNQMVDFLNAQVIQYALMVNPTIYVSCIKQFWATVSIKKVKDVVKLQALIDRKKEIFVELVRMGYEKQPLKLIFYKAFFTGQWKFLIHTLVQCMMLRGLPGMNSVLLWPQLLSSLPQVAALEQDKVAQALEILKLKRRVKKLKKQRRSKFSRGCIQTGVRIKEIDADEEITLVDIEIQDDLGVELQGRIEEKDEVNTLIKIKAKKARLMDEKMAKRLHNEEVKQAAAREKQEQDNFKRAQKLQQQEYNKVQTFLKPDRDEEPTKKRVAKETLLQESFKKLRAEVKVLGSHSTQDTPTDDPKEITDVFWKLQRYMYDPLTWKLYTNCEVHQVSSTRRHDIFMFPEKDYLLIDVVLLLMLSTKLQVDEDCEMARDLVMKIFMEANKPKSKKNLDTSSK
nr:hypothetical protein [Tanacetum cinerariifolium]